MKRIAVRKPFVSRSSAVRTGWEAVRTARGIRSKNILSRSNGSSFPFKKNCQPFERLELSVQKKLSAVRTARAIRSKKIVSRSNGSSYPFKNNCQPFERLWLSVQKNSPAVRRRTARAVRARFQKFSLSRGTTCQMKKSSTLRRRSRLYELCKLLVCLTNFVCLVTLNNLFKTYQKLKFKSA